MRRGLLNYYQTTILILFSIWAPLLAQSDYANLKWQYIGFNYAPGNANIICQDIDKDNSEELIVDFNGNFFSIIEYKDGDYQTKWTSTLLDNSIKDIKIYDLDNDSNLDICILLSSGKILVYDSQTYEARDTLQLNLSYPTSLDIADIDNDSTVEFVIKGRNSITIINSETLENEWDTTDNAFNSEIKVGNVDSDFNDEIIVASGYVIDGRNHNVEWFFPNGFGSEIELADVDNDSIKEIISIANYYDINAYDAELKTPLWSITSEDAIESLYIPESTDSSKVEIIVGNNQHGDLQCFNGIDKSLLWKIDNPNHGTINIAVGDLDKDGERDLIWSSGASTSGSDHLYIASIESKEVNWTSKNYKGPFNIDVFDTDNDSFDEIIGNSRENLATRGYPAILSFNSITHEPELYLDEFMLNYRVMSSLLADNINESEQGEILATIYQDLFLIDGKTFQIVRNKQIAEINQEITSLAIGDIDKDGIKEIVAGNESGYIYVVNAETFSEEWHSIKTNSRIQKIQLVNCDNDEADEIVFLKSNGGIEIYDGKTHYLEWQSTDLSGIVNFDIIDFDDDGVLDIVAGNSIGELYIINTLTKEISDTLSLNLKSMTGLKICNLDSDKSKEIIVGTDRLLIFNLDDLSLEYSSAKLAYSNVGYKNNIVVKDVDNNQKMDIFLSSDLGLHHFECSDLVPDVSPPRVFSTLPSMNARNIGLNETISITFNESVLDSSLTDKNISLFFNDTTLISKKLKYFDNEKTLQIVPDTLLPKNTVIKVVSSGNIVDDNFNGLDGNSNGIAEGSPIDDYTFYFTTGSNIDSQGPNFSNVNINRTELWQGFDINITALLSDSSEIAESKIYSAECFIDSINDFGSGLAILPTDFIFDSIKEEVHINIPTNGWSVGLHTLYLVGYDNVGNKGQEYIIPINIFSEDKMDANWPMIGQNPQNTNYNFKDSIQVPLAIKWIKKTFSNPLNKALVVDSLIFATETIDQNSSLVKALHVETGDTVWTFQIGYSKNILTPAYYKGRLFIPTEITPYGGRLYVIDATNGEYLWDKMWYSFNYHSGIAPIVADDKVFIAGNRGKLLVFDVFTGETLWRSDIAFNHDWVPAYSDGKIYTCGINSYMSFYSDSGNVASEFGLNPIGETPVLDGDIIFTQNPITAINYKTNDSLWSSPGTIPPSVADGKVYIANSQDLIVLDKFSGQQLWTYKAFNIITDSPVITNKYIFLNTIQNFCAINRSTHKEEMSYPYTGKITVANNKLYLAMSSGQLACYEYDYTNTNEDAVCSITEYKLNQNYPNPFNPTTIISYSIIEKGHVELKVFDVLGKEVGTLVNQEQKTGNYKVEFNASNLSSGVYFYRLKSRNFNSTKKLILLK